MLFSSNSYNISIFFKYLKVVLSKLQVDLVLPTFIPYIIKHRYFYIDIFPPSTVIIVVECQMTALYVRGRHYSHNNDNKRETPELH